MRISSKWMSGFCEEFLKYGRQSFIEIRAPSILAANGPNLAALVPRQKKEMEKAISCFEAFLLICSWQDIYIRIDWLAHHKMRWGLWRWSTSWWENCWAIISRWSWGSRVLPLSRFQLPWSALEERERNRLPDEFHFCRKTSFWGFFFKIPNFTPLFSQSCSGNKFYPPIPGAWGENSE